LDIELFENLRNKLMKLNSHSTF